MTQKSKELLLDMLHERNNGYIASKLHLQHQLSLPPEHRITDTGDDEMVEMLRELRKGSIELERVIMELEHNGNYSTLPGDE